MNKELSEFNQLLKRNKNAIGVIQNDDSICASVSAKANTDFLKEAIEEGIKEDMDYEDVSLVSVQSSDYGHRLSIEVSYQQDGATNVEKYSITHTIVY